MSPEKKRLPAPKSCFWELTRKCDHLCIHCRANAQVPLPDELDLNAALGVADQLVSLGVSLVILTGGEPMLFEGWQQIAGRLSQGGVKVRLFTSGSLIDASS